MRRALQLVGLLGWLESLVLSFYAVTLPMAGRGPLFVFAVLAFIVGSICIARSFREV